MKMKRLFALLSLSVLSSLAACSSTAKTREISAASMGADYPFTVPSGELRCEKRGSGGELVIFRSGGKDYGVNGTAQSSGYPAIDPIWKSAVPGPKVQVGTVIKLGRDLCQ
ncbi:hypothetical protein H6F43_03310 [Leptolyngbya sp. FACHB-36]|uniref:hypothetical protein n=1 Tax=Leptolyngbya sp. FACHB-36 TaxID=2692808 RepID=UPI0016812B88|nr:hypothetical protein [Leptolyngbya sp. FACHB-36]MBD2019212.1 hypothetical protein [Leptolyngbya sp. FACHB-36]